MLLPFLPVVAALLGLVVAGLALVRLI